MVQYRPEVSAQIRIFFFTAGKRQYPANANGSFEVCGIRAKATKSANLLLLRRLRLICLPAESDLRRPDLYFAGVSLPLTSSTE